MKIKNAKSEKNAINGRRHAPAAAWATIDAVVLRDAYSSGTVQPDARICTQYHASDDP